jgi:internalin A
MREHIIRSLMTVWSMTAGALLCPLQAATGQAKKAPEPLPANIVNTWQAAGGKVGWMSLPGRRVAGNDHLVFTAEPAAHSVPACRFERWQPGVLARLAAPAQAFGLDLKGSTITDEGLKELTGFRHLTVLNLHGTKVTDAGLKQLAGLKNLTMLELTATTDETLRKLREFGLLQALPGAWRLAPSIQLLSIGGTPLRAGSAEQIILLDLPDSQVTDAGLKELADCKTLATLNLTQSHKITGTGLKYLAGLKKLTELNLFGIRGLTPAGLKELARIKSLTTLHLDYTDINDAGLKQLASLKNLTVLTLLNALKITDAGVDALQKALPKCRIQRRDDRAFPDF